MGSNPQGALNFIAMLGLYSKAMNTKKITTGQHLSDHWYMKQEDAGCDFTSAEDNSINNNAQESAVTMACAVATCRSVLTNPTHPPDSVMSTDNSCEDTQPIQKHPLSYVALISKCILSSPLQKLNLASIYRAMEEQYPYLRSRGPGWRNSVRHNLSVNDCFVKVSRCENGRGHYWGVHPAHLRHFQQGDYRQHRKARERRERERHNEGTGCWVCSSFLLSGLEPYCFPLEQQRYKMSYFNWTEAHNQLWSGNVGWLQSPNSITQYYFPERTGHMGRMCELQLGKGTTDNLRPSDCTAGRRMSQ